MIAMLKRPLPQKECSKGWKSLIDELVADLDVLTGAHQIETVQIKEKFVTLRFYIDRSANLRRSRFG